MIAETLLIAAGIYLLCGLVFTIPFVLVGVAKKRTSLVLYLSTAASISGMQHLLQRLQQGRQLERLAQKSLYRLGQQSGPIRLR